MVQRTTTAFVGVYNHDLSPKGRIKIPMEFRRLITPDEWVIVPIEGPALAIGTLSVLFNAAEAGNDQKALNLLRDGAPFCTRLQMTRSGVLSFPTSLREHLSAPQGQKVEMVEVGRKDHFQIWPRELYEEEAKRIKKKLEKRRPRKLKIDLKIPTSEPKDP